MPALFSPRKPFSPRPCPSMSTRRGRKRNDNLPPNRAREVQRAFRARRAAHLKDLEDRVSELEEENNYLRQALNLPRSNRPPLGRGPTGKDKPKTYIPSSASVVGASSAPTEPSPSPSTSSDSVTLVPISMSPNTSMTVIESALWDNSSLLLDHRGPSGPSSVAESASGYSNHGTEITSSSKQEPHDSYLTTPLPLCGQPNSNHSLSPGHLFAESYGPPPHSSHAEPPGSERHTRMGYNYMTMPYPGNIGTVARSRPSQDYPLSDPHQPLPPHPRRPPSMDLNNSPVHPRPSHCPSRFHRHGRVEFQGQRDTPSPFPRTRTYAEPPHVFAAGHNYRLTNDPPTQADRRAGSQQVDSSIIPRQMAYGPETNVHHVF